MLTPKPLPELPENVTRENVVEFAKEYDRVHLWNEVLTNRTANISGGYRAELLRETATGYVVHLEASFGVTYRMDEADETATAVAVADLRYTANYFINETTVLRAETSGVNVHPGPTPLNGTVVREPTNSRNSTSTTLDLPLECGNAVSFEELSGELQEEFRMSLDEGGLVLNESVRIDDELPDSYDAIGPEETCILFEESYYYPSLGPVRDGQLTLTYEVADGYKPEIGTRTGAATIRLELA